VRARQRARSAPPRAVQSDIAAAGCQRGPAWPSDGSLGDMAGVLTTRRTTSSGPRGIAAREPHRPAISPSLRRRLAQHVAGGGKPPSRATATSLTRRQARATAAIAKSEAIGAYFYGARARRGETSLSISRARSPPLWSGRVRLSSIERKMECAAGPCGIGAALDPASCPGDANPCSRRAAGRRPGELFS
jgi:hypothetical protein